ncbi:MAG: hypothetical protein ACD_62C00036G0005 [uncultured bacterium]|nr:MAG: hypothetical protein ACD_62C00036G0005 [uncultured bacterium]HLD45531.1 Panacea domain-containing protein [bacterium]
MSVQKVKYKNVILFFCQQLGGELRGKKKLAKLLYFLDFDFYEWHDVSITNDVYKALPMGPYPSHLSDMISEMTDEKLLFAKTEKVHAGYLATEIYTNKFEPDLKVFSKDEIKMLERVVSHYGHLNGKQLEDLSHAEAPYVGTEPSKEIAYELSYYRGTDFADL